jgi:hypothetical protein
MQNSRFSVKQIRKASPRAGAALLAGFARKPALSLSKGADFLGKTLEET